MESERADCLCFLLSGQEHTSMGHSCQRSQERYWRCGRARVGRERYQLEHEDELPACVWR